MRNSCDVRKEKQNWHFSDSTFVTQLYLVLSETGHWVVGAGTVIISASVDRLPGVVDFLVIPQMILASKRSMTDITEESLCLAVDQNVSLQLELWCELLVTIWGKSWIKSYFFAICWPTWNLALKWSFAGVRVFMLPVIKILWNHHDLQRTNGMRIQ